MFEEAARMMANQRQEPIAASYSFYGTAMNGNQMLHHMYQTYEQEVNEHAKRKTAQFTSDSAFDGSIASGLIFVAYKFYYTPQEMLSQSLQRLSKEEAHAFYRRFAK